MISLLLSSVAMAQTLSWQAPENDAQAEGEVKIKGYRVMYEIQPDDGCDPKQELRHFVDVGMTYTYKIHDDPNFMPDTNYKLAMVSYNGVALSQPTEYLCVRTRPLPDVDMKVEDDLKANNNKQQGDKNEEVILAHVGEPDAADSDGGASNGQVDAQPKRHERVRHRDRTLSSLLGFRGASGQSVDRVGAAAAESSEHGRGRNEALFADYVEAGVVGGTASVLRDDGSDARRGGRTDRVGSLWSSLQGHGVSRPPGTGDSGSRVILWVLIATGLVLAFAGFIGLSVLKKEGAR